jgi:hypothetical protein
MNTVRLFWNNSLYIVLPILFCVILQILFSYAAWDINPRNWPIEVRTAEAFIFVVAMVFGVSFANDIYKKQNV